MADTLAGAVESGKPREHRDELLLQALRLRTETVEAAALPGADMTPAATWTYLSAAEDLIRMVAGPQAEPVDDPAGLGRRLRAMAGGADLPEPGPGAGLVEQEVARMGRAVTALRP
jgi:hypothetical protein